MNAINPLLLQNTKYQCETKANQAGCEISSLFAWLVSLPGRANPVHNGLRNTRFPGVPLTNGHGGLECWPQRRSLTRRSAPVSGTIQSES